MFQNQEDTIWVGTGNGVRIFNKVTQQFSRFHDDGNLNDSLLIGCVNNFSGQTRTHMVWQMGPWIDPV